MRSINLQPARGVVPRASSLEFISCAFIGVSFAEIYRLFTAFLATNHIRHAYEP